jgi:hypothetical protein
MAEKQADNQTEFDYFPRIPALMSPSEIGTALGVSPATVTRLLASGCLHPVVTEHEEPVYLRSDIVDYVKENFFANEVILDDGNTTQTAVNLSENYQKAPQKAPN